ncbi:MAG: B12-binding domain-containing radical SAM protein [Deltaproteobacteria bacterium]|nr:B12-binding domain-containing radical SAM protein [Deltaproteobacteria bacterium]
MTDVLFIQPPNVQGTLFNLPGAEVPLSVMSVSAYLKREGYSSEIWDLTLDRRPEEALARLLAGNAPHAVGITSYTTNMDLAADIASKVRAAWPKTKLVVGGFHASALPERTIREYPVFDVLVHGEGEVTMVELLEAWGRGDDGTDVHGTAFRENGHVRMNPPRDLLRDLDALPYADRDAVPVTRYVPDPGNYASLPTTGILYSRGCPAPCTFCSKSVFLDSVRYRTPQSFLDEIRTCKRDYGIHDFRLYDEGPTFKRRHMEALCDEILASGLRFSWNCFSRVDVADEELLTMMRDAGCYHIIYGVESVVPETQRRIRKRIDAERVREVCRLTRKLGIECKANFILGFPWEGEDEAEQNVRFALGLDADLVTFNLFKPMPGSPLYDEMSERGAIRDLPWKEFFTTSNSELFESRLDEHAQKRILKWAWMRFYFSPKSIRRRLERLVRHPVVETRKVARGLGVLLVNLFK